MRNAFHRSIVPCLGAAGLALLPRGGLACQEGAVWHDEAPGEPAVASIAGRTTHPVLPAGEVVETYVHLAVRAVEVPDAPRLGMNLALVIDRSGSMASEDKLRFAKQAAQQVVERLRPDDRLAIVAYDDEICTVVPPTLAAERRVFHTAIEGLDTGGSTDLCGGLTAGVEAVLAHFDERRVNGVMLLSDGLANVGVKSADEIAGRAAGFRDRGVRVSTLGMGLDYDEDLLMGVALRAGGNYHYVAEAETVGGFLDGELDEMGCAVARDVRVRIVPGDGVELREVYAHVERQEGNTTLVDLRDLYGGQERKIVLRLGVRGSVGETRELLRATLSSVDAKTRARRVSEVPPVTVRFSDDLAEVRAARDLETLARVEVVQNGVALDRAMRLQKDGRYQEAQELLGARYLNSKIVNETELHDPEVERTLWRIQKVMQDLERTRSNPQARRDLQLESMLHALGYTGG